MKKLLLLLSTAALLTACNRDEKEERKISPRNTAITKAIAYNDLFMDSLSLVKYIKDHDLPDSVGRRMISFYNTRNYQYAWFGSNGIAEQGMGFSSLLNFTDDTSGSLKDLHQVMNGVIGAGNIRITAGNRKILKAELELTENLIRYTKANFKKGYVKRSEVEQFIPAVKTDALQLADSLLKEIDKQKKGFSEINEAYRLLSEQLKKWVTIEKEGVWPVIEAAPGILKKGASDRLVVVLKKNLFLNGDLPSEDSTALFNDPLHQAVMRFQERHGFTPDGKITSSLLKLMNRSPRERIRQLLINMNRMRWLPHDSKGRLIMVNTPDFSLRVMEDGKEIFKMPVVVGKEGHNTTIFSDMLTTIVFSPYWNIPESIIQKEILPEMEKDSEYLDRNDMEINGEINGLPKIRQRPGPENSLGKVKFLFPNSFNIYFHDTPAKALFDRDVRTFSHGCIRLAEPEKLASYLLKDNRDWDEQKIHRAMNAGKEKFVSLKVPVPVFITYYTAWVDENGVLQLRNDIYGHDKQVAAKMFKN